MTLLLFFQHVKNNAIVQVVSYYTVYSNSASFSEILSRLMKAVRQKLMSSYHIVSFPDPAFKLDKGLVHFARNLGLADSALPEIWRTNQIAYTC